MNPALQTLLMVALILFILLNLAAVLIWLERRLLAFLQDRLGPNRCGPFGLLFIAADMIKIFTKEDWVPPFADKPIFILAPAIIVVTALLSFSIIPFAPGVVILDLNIGLLFFLAMSSIGIYSTVLAGWASNNKYALLGGLRMSAQMLSYEVFMGLSLMGVVAMAGSFRLSDIVAAQEKMWFVVPQFLGFLIFFIVGTAETHRLPFDMPEAESELIVLLFFGGWMGPLLPPLVWFALKTSVFIFIFILFRAALPRPRYDQFMAYGWKILLPLSLLNLVATGGILLAAGS
jgi:NADH-quinone oxidoreductase subunit H